MHRSENIREPSGDRTSRDITFEHGTSGNVTRPLIDTTGRGGHVDPASQSGGMQMVLAMAYREGYKLKAKLRGGVGVGDPKDYQPAKIAEHGFSEDNRKQLKLEKAKNQGATASSSNASHEASSNSEEVYSHSDDGWTVIEEELTFQWPSKPKNPEKEVQPNDPDTYQNELLREGYRPRPPQGFEHIVRSLSPGWKKTNSMIEVINSEQNNEKYRDGLNEVVLNDVELAKSIAKELYRERIEKAKYKLYDEIDNSESNKLKELKSKISNQDQKEQNLQEIRNQENKLQKIKEQKEKMKEKLHRIRDQKEEDLKDHKDKKEKILQNIEERDNILKDLKEQKRNLKTDRDKISNDQEIERNEKELKDLKEQKIEELEKIARYKKELQKIERLEENLQKIKQLEGKLQELKKARDEYAKDVFERFSQNQEHAANRLAKEVEAILKRNDKSMQWLRLNLFRSNGIRF